MKPIVLMYLDGKNDPIKNKIKLKIKNNNIFQNKNNNIFQN